MNSNEHPDKHLLERIEQALDQGKSAEDPLLNDLTQIVPQASQDFQQQLENQLIAHLYPKGEQPVTTTHFAPSSPSRKPMFFPLTLVAAVVIMLLVGSILLNGNGKLPDPTSVVALQAETQTPVLEPTASPLIRIVVAYQNIPRGFHFPDTLEALQQIAGYAAWPLESVPFTALGEDGGGLEQLAGKIARTDIYREQPILSSLVIDNPTDLATIGSDLALLLPQNTVAISIPFTSVQSTSGDLVAGDYVNVIAAVLFVNADANFQSGISTPFLLTPPVSGTAVAPRVMLQNIVKNALVVQIGTFPSEENGTPQPTAEAASGDVITLAVSPDDATILRWVVDAQIPLSLSQTIPVESTLKPVVVARQFIPRGTQLTADQLTVIYMNPDFVPQNALETVGQAEGLYLNNPLEVLQPLVASSTQEKPLFVERILPVNMVVRGVPVTLISGMTPGLQNGDMVDITAHFLYPVWPDDALAFGPNTLPTTEVVPAQGGKVERGLVVQSLILKGIRVYNMGDINEPPHDNPLTIALAMTVDEAALLEWVTESTKPFALTLTREEEPVDLHAETLPDGRVSVELPIQAVHGVTAVDATPVAPTSNRFDIFMSLDFTAQASDRPARIAAQNILQVVAPDAELLNAPQDIFVGNVLMNATFLVAPEDLPKLEWAVKSGMQIGVSWRP